MAYLNVDEVESAIAGLVAAYPSLCESIGLPNKTFEGRTCHAIRIGVNRDDSHVGVLFTACVHAREWGGADICIGFAADLLEAYNAGTGLKYGGKTFTGATVQSIVSRLNVFVFPDANPDGRNYSQTVAPLWRKNRNPVNSGGDSSRIGIDNNRNQDFLWNFPVEFSPAANPNSLASTDPASDLYHGPSVESEPETQNIRWLLDNYPGIHWYMDIHSYTGDILYSWGDDENQSDTTSMNFRNPAFNGQRGLIGDTYREYIPPDDLGTVSNAAARVRDAMNAVRGQAYQAKQSFFLDVGNSLPYPTSGANDDYSYSRHFADTSKGKVFGFTLEFGFTDFHPAWSDMQDIIRDVSSGMIEFCRNSIPVYIVRVPSWWRWLFPWQILGPLVNWYWGLIVRVGQIIVRITGGGREE